MVRWLFGWVDEPDAEMKVRNIAVAFPLVGVGWLIVWAVLYWVLEVEEVKYTWVVGPVNIIGGALFGIIGLPLIRRRARRRRQ